MAEFVQKGDKILASQYNALVTAVKGPGQPSPNVPFTQTSDGTVYNGGNNTQVRNPNILNPLFNISTGCGAIDDIYNGWVDNNSVFNGVWTQLSDWRNTLSYLYHDNFMISNTELYLIDPTSIKGQAKLIGFPFGTMGKDVKWPICELSSQAGLAVFQLMEDPEEQDVVNGGCAIIMGDFSLFDTDTEAKGHVPNPNFYNDYLTAIQSAYGGTPYFRATKIAMRHAVPLYVTPYHEYISPEDPLASPVAWTVGQQHIESMPDKDMESNWVGSTCWLSSIQFTPQKQLGIIGRDVPTWSYSLYGFDKYDANYDSLSAIQHANHPDGSPGGDKELSCFDVLLKHKVKHPYADSGLPQLSGQAQARLEYMPLSCLVSPGDTNANKDGNINTGLSSVELATIDGNAFYELYGFQRNGTLNPSDLSSGVEVVVRDFHSTGGNGAMLNYVPLSSITESLSGGVSISGDTNVIPGYSRSIQTTKDSRGQYHQLYGFENPATRNFYQLSEGKYQFVIRDYNSQDKQVVYSDTSSFINDLVISGDANFQSTPSKTIMYKNQLGRRYYQLYGWQGYDHTPMVAEIEADGQIHYINEVNGQPGPKHFLVEDHQTGELEYHALGIKIPPPELSSIEGGDEIIQNITVLSTDLSALSADLSSQLSSFWVKGEDSQENYGSSIGDSGKNTVINLDTKRLNGTWYTDNGDMNVGGTCSANKLETNTVLQIGNTTLTETQLQQLLRLI